MWVDPIVEEIRAIRRQLAEEAGNDLHEICRRLRESEKERRKEQRAAKPRARRTAARKP